MADSDFWRDLADRFFQLQDRLRAGGASDFYSALETLTTRGASEIAGADASDLLAIWIEGLKKEGLDFHSSYQSNEVLSAADYEQDIKVRAIDGMCQASVTFCNKREAEAGERNLKRGNETPRARNTQLTKAHRQVAANAPTREKH